MSDKQTTFFRVDGFSAIRHDDDTRKNLQALKEQNQNINQSKIVRKAIVAYASGFGYEGSSPIFAMKHIEDMANRVLAENGLDDICDTNASKIIKAAIALANENN